MNDTRGNQNGQNNGEKKSQLSWSQPLQTQVPKTPIQTPAAEQPKKPEQPVHTPHMSGPVKNNTGRNVMVVVALVIVLIAGIAIANSKRASTGTAVTSTATSTNTGATQSDAMTDGSLSVSSPQNAGLQVAVSNASVTVPTWVVIYENYNGKPGNVLGAALFTPERQSGNIDLLRGTVPGQTYFAGESQDNGDHMYSIITDPVVRDTSGNLVSVTFQTR